MDFDLKGQIEFNKPVEFLEKELAEIKNEINNELFMKGVPKEKEGAKLVSWDIKENNLTVNIKSKEYTRSHDAILRLKNYLAEKFGKEYKIGVRYVSAKEYTITLDELDKLPIKDITVPFVKNVKVEGEKIILELEELTEIELRKRFPDKIIDLVKEKINQQHYKGKAEHWELLWESPQKKIIWDKDPSEEMEKRGWLKRGPGLGQWVFGPIATKLMRTMEKITKEELLEPLGFEEVILPKMITFDIWQKSGHMRGS